MLLLIYGNHSRGGDCSQNACLGAELPMPPAARYLYDSIQIMSMEDGWFCRRNILEMNVSLRLEMGPLVSMFWIIQITVGWQV